MALISPDPAVKTEHLKLLLGLADDVNHVQTTMDGPTGLAFVVPDYLAEQYEKALKFQAGEDQGDEGDDEETSDNEDAPVKRKPGRPKKNPDNGA